MIPRDAVRLYSRDDRLLSPCHRVAVCVVFGELVVAADGQWSHEIDRYCTSCEAKVEAAACTAGPGTEFAARNAPKGTE